MEITCPSGLRGEIRGMRMREFGMFTDAKIIRRAALSNDIVTSCWVKTLDPGPYPFGADMPKKLPWDRMVHADKLFAFKEVRRATRGDQLEWETQCEDGTCRARFLASVNLATMEVKPLSEAAKNVIKTGIPFTTKVGGKTVTYRPLLGKDEYRIQKMLKSNDVPLAFATYMVRLDTVEGLNDIGDIEELCNWYGDLSLDDAEELQDKMDDTEAILDVSVDITCPTCGVEWQSVIPLVLNFLTKPGSTPKQKRLFGKKGKVSSKPSSTPPGTSETSEDQP